MPDDLAKLRPAANPDYLRQTLAYALEFAGRRKRFRHADGLMAEIIADHLAEHLEQCGYIIMRKPPIGGFSHISQGPKPRS